MFLSFFCFSIGFLLNPDFKFDFSRVDTLDLKVHASGFTKEIEDLERVFYYLLFSSI